MGMYDRGYVRTPREEGWSRPGGLSITVWLLIINAAVFVLQMLMPKVLNFGGRSVDALFFFGHFSTYEVTWQGGLEFWRFLTFQFLHANFMHLLSNGLGLWLFGNIVEQQLGGRRFLAFYLTCGVCGALMYLLLNAAGQMAGQGTLPAVLPYDLRTPLVGASAGIFGIALAAAKIAPDVRVMLLIPPIPVTIRVLAWVYVGIAVVVLFTGGNNAGGEAAHLGGAIAGFVLIRNLHLLRDFFDVFTDSRKRAARAGAAKKAARSEPSAAVARSASSSLEAEVDRILAKVQAQGLHSLTEREKRTLQEATQKRREG